MSEQHRSNKSERTLRRSCLARFRKSEEGAAAVEFGLVAGPFFLLVFAIIETCLAFFAGQVLESSVDDAARNIRTGEIQGGATGNYTEAQFKQDICNRGFSLFNCQNMHIDVQTFPDFASVPLGAPADPAGNLDPSGMGFCPGGPSTINLVRAYYEWPVALDYLWASSSGMSNGKRLLVATAAFRNEPYNGGGC